MRAHDPQGMDAARVLFPNVTFCADAYAAAEGADVVVIATEWDAFRALDFERLGGIVRQRIIVDLRNLYRPQDVARQGFVYHSLGRAVARPEAGARLRAVGTSV